MSLAPSGIARLADAAIDERILGFTLLLTTTTAVAFGLLPAMQFSRPARDVMRERRSTGPRVLLRRTLVGGEVALALVLLVGAGLLVRSFQRLLSVDPFLGRWCGRTAGVLAACYVPARRATRVDPLVALRID